MALMTSCASRHLYFLTFNTLSQEELLGVRLASFLFLGMWREGSSVLAGRSVSKNGGNAGGVFREFKFLEGAQEWLLVDR